MTRLTGALACHSPWTPVEDETLRESYSRGGIDAAAEALPHRSRNGLFRRAQRLGLSRRRRWTAEDDARLRLLWDGGSSLSDIARALGRTEMTTYWRAQHIGLPLGVPDGWELLTHAARRTGFLVSQLRAILAAAGVHPRRVISRPYKPRGRVGRGRLRYMVVPGEVDLAVEQWLEGEPLEAAARRVGLRGDVLARRLRAVGIERPPMPRKHRWRVTSEQVEAAMRAAR